MKTLARCLALWLVLAGCVGLAQAAGEPARIEIEIIHTNDLHGYIVANGGPNGGAGAIANVIAAARKRAEKDPAYGCVAMDCGDIFGGSAEDSYSRGKMLTDFMCGAGYDVFVIGNHDFGYGLPTLMSASKAMREHGVKVLACNIRNAKDGSQASQLCDGDTVLTVKGIKLGIVGVTTSGTPRMSLDEDVAGLDFQEPAPALAERVAALKKAGASVIIVGSHVGFDNGKYVDDKKLAAGNADVQVIVGAHTHTVLERPVQVNKSVIVQTGSQGRNIGSFTLVFDGKTKKPLLDSNGLVQNTYKLIDLGSQSGANPLADQLRKTYWEPIGAKLEEVTGNLQVGLYRKFYKTDGLLGNFLADAALEASGGAQISLCATSELRADLRKGEARLKDIFQVVPFENEIVRLKVKGKLIKELVDAVYGDGRRMIAVAGMTIAVDSRKPEGQRVQWIKVGTQPMADDTEYDLATTNYVAQGKGGFRPFAFHEYQKTGKSNRDAIVAHLKKLGTVTFDTIRMYRLKDAALEEEIGRVSKTFSTEIDSQQPNLYDVIATSLLGKPARGDLSLIDTFGIHWKLTEKYPVVKKDLFELVAYDNEVMTVQLPGDKLEKVLKQIVARQGNRLSVYIGGGTLVVNNGAAEVLIGGQPVQAGKTYTLVTYDHLLAGAKGFEPLGDMHLQGKPLGLKMRESLATWIKAVTPIGIEDFPEKPGLVVGQPVNRTVNRLRNFDSMGNGAPSRPSRRPAAETSDDPETPPPPAEE